MGSTRRTRWSAASRSTKSRHRPAPATRNCARAWCKTSAGAPEGAPPDPSSGAPMDLNLTGKHALVCGASEGIGRAAAHELALLGANVTVLARRAEALQDVVDALPRVGGQAHDFIAADVSRTDALGESVT